MTDLTNIHDTDEPTIRFKIDVALPAENVAAFVEAMTGNDDDVLLAAETAIRERLGRETTRELELSYEDFEPELREHLTQEAGINRRREALYGPVA